MFYTKKCCLASEIEMKQTAKELIFEEKIHIVEEEEIIEAENIPTKPETTEKIVPIRTVQEGKTIFVSSIHYYHFKKILYFQISIKLILSSL